MARARISRGSVLVIVMVTLMFTTFALVMFIEQATSDLLVTSRDQVNRRLRRDAYSVLEATLATLEEFRRADGALHSPAEGWNDPLGFSGWTPRAGITAQVTLADESGKISLAHVDSGMLANLFKAWDLKQPDAERLTDAILGWIKRDYVPISSRAPEYDQGDLPFEAPARPMRSFDELAAIDFVREKFFDEQGRPNDLWRRFVAAFSLYDYQQLNLNAVTSDVMAAVGFSDPSQYGKLRDFVGGTGGYSNIGPQWLSSTAQAGGVMGSATMPANLGVQVRALRVSVTVHEGRNEFRLSAVVAPAGGATIVKTTATSTKSAASGTTTAAAAAPTVAPTPPAPQLNYPFTLLEIKENGEIPTAPPETPAA